MNIIKANKSSWTGCSAFLYFSSPVMWRLMCAAQHLSQVQRDRFTQSFCSIHDLGFIYVFAAFAKLKQDMLDQPLTYEASKYEKI